MAAAVTYTTFGGMLIHEDRGGVERQYISDPLGSLVGELDSTQSTTYTAEYWPFGEVQTETGTNTSPWNFAGLLGYIRDLATLLYVRARYYLNAKARWLTTDPVWPAELPYAYVNGMPTFATDPSGLLLQLILPAGILAIMGLLSIIAELLGITLLAIIAILLIYGLIYLWHWLCRKIRARMKDICGDENRPPQGGPCNCFDSCLSLLYKSQANMLCAVLRALESGICYFDFWEPGHMLQIEASFAWALECKALFYYKNCQVVIPFPILPFPL